MRSSSPPRVRHAAALSHVYLHLLLALALMLQALTGASAVGAMHRHGPASAGSQEAPLQVLIDFRRTAHAAEPVMHAQPGRHHHGAAVVDVVRTAEDQAADRSQDAADGLGAQLALLPPDFGSALTTAAPPQVARQSWMATLHEPALPERPPRPSAARSANA